MAELTLLRGQVAIVDDEDLPKVVGHRWLLSTKGYVICRQKPKNIWLHRLVAGTPEGLDTDHRDRNKLNNRKDNLRHATRRQNTGNRRMSKSGMSSKFKGVYWHGVGKGYWRARFGYRTEDGKIKHQHLGLFDNETDAATAYNEAAVKHFGAEYALTNEV